MSLFDAEDSCYGLNIAGVGELSRQEVLQLKNPVNGENLKVCYDSPTDPHHMIIDNVPYQHEHPSAAEALAGNIARHAVLRPLRAELQRKRS
ncbi:MAG: hypothetical protein WB992_21675 [Bryobacteraceae bacterium]